MRKAAVTLAVGVAALGVATGVALAGKPSSSLGLVVLSSGWPLATATTAQPSYGGQITFDVSTTETDHPNVNVRCYQGTIFVYDAWQGFWPGYYTDPIFTLSSGYWTGDAADCVARLVSFSSNGRETTLASTAFHVNA